MYSNITENGTLATEYMGCVVYAIVPVDILCNDSKKNRICIMAYGDHDVCMCAQFEYDTLRIVCENRNVFALALQIMCSLNNTQLQFIFVHQTEDLFLQ